MAKFFKTAGIVVLILLVLVLLLTGIGRLLGGASPLSQFLQAALSPVDKLLGSGVAKLEDIYGYMHDYDQLKEENAALKARIAEMANEVRRSQDANEENERLRTLLNLQRAHRSSDREQTARKQPFTEVVVVTESPESSRADGRDDALKTL